MRQSEQQRSRCGRKGWMEGGKRVGKGGGVYTHTVCLNRCVEGEPTVVEEGDITMHRRTLRRFLYVTTPLAASLSLSLCPFSRSSTCVYIVLYAIYEPVCPPVTREPFTHTRGSSSLPAPRRKYINCPRSRRYRQLLLPLLHRADSPTRVYYVSRPVSSRCATMPAALLSTSRRASCRASVGEE